MKLNIKKKLILISLSFIAAIIFSNISYSQYAVKWMSVGSLHNWYSEIGCEVEEGFIKEQQYGLQWPAIHPHQDMQAAKALWIGVENFTDDRGQSFPHKVVHVGPRVTGGGEFFPISFKMYSKFDPPLVFVDDDLSQDKSVDNDEVDPTMIADRMIVNVVNTQTGITMTRKIFQFGQQYHSNYIITEYTFKNTGNVDADPEIELPNQTLNGVYFYYQYRLSVCANTRYEIGNETGWGMNAMLDTRGDGVKVDPEGENFRAQYVWHGKYPPFNAYDNIGGPLWTDAVNVEAGDTVGRLGAAQFVGVVTLHADKSASDNSDDPGQPSTTSWEGSDEPLTSNNDAYNKAKMDQEYVWMSKGHKSPRHADVVQPDGNFINPSNWGDPALGTGGGFSNANGYGPYTLAPGDSVVIVIAEAASGISYDAAVEYGKMYKRKQITAADKNAEVMTGRDSLFQTFNRAIANYNSGYNIPEPPLPPKIFNVNGGGDRISLSWDTYGTGPAPDGFEIYRASGKYDSTYHLLYTAAPDERSYDDKSAIRGLSYYYYIVSVGSAASNDGTGLTPAGKLRSSRYYTQTYNEANLKRPSGDSPYSAKVTGGQTAPFLIQAGVNNKLIIDIDNLGADTITIKANSEAVDSLTIKNIVGQINVQLGYNVAADNGFGQLVLISPTTGLDSKINILPAQQDAYSAIGLNAGVTSGGVPTIQEALDKIRVVPNPYNISASTELGFGELQPNRLAFFNIPGECTIKIYTELGELVQTIEHTDGSGDEYWDSTTSSNQIVVSGIYIAVVEDTKTGERKIVKFVIIR